MAHLLLEAGGERSLSAPTESVWKLRYSGTVEDLCLKLGQRDFNPRDHDADLAAKVKAAIQAIDAPGFRTSEAKAALHNFLGELDRIIQQPTHIHRVLNQIGQDQALNEARTCFPSWANGAHVFVTSDVADEIQEALKSEELRPCDVVVAEQFRGYIDAAISAESPEPHFRPPKLKPGQSKRYPMVESAAAFFRAFYSEARRLDVRPASLSSRDCVSTGYKRKFKMVKLPHTQEALCEGNSSPEVDQADTVSIAFTFDEILSDDVAEEVIQRLLKSCDAKPPLCKDEQTFSAFVVERLESFRGDIVRPLVDELIPELGSQMPKQATREEVKRYLDRYVKMLETKLFGDDVFIKFFKLGKQALKREYKGTRREALVEAWSESVDMFAMGMKEELGKTMLVAKKAAWKLLRSDVDRFARDSSVDMSHKLGRILVDCIDQSIDEANPQKVAVAAYTRQRQKYKANRSAQPRAVHAKLDQKPLGDRPAWMRDEARRHLEAGGSSGQYHFACGLDDED